MKVRYKSKDGTYESVAYLDEDSAEPFYWRIYTGINKHTDERIEVILTSTGWEEV